MKVAFVLGTTAGGTLRHVQMLAAGCAARGVPALVCGPAEHAPDFPSYQTVQFGDRVSVRDGRAVRQLRRILSREQPDVVHAHGLRAGALSALALSLATRPSRAALPLVVTVHNAPPASGANATVYQGLQFLVARSAAVVLCVSRDLEDRMRGAGARDVRRALVPPYDPAAPAESPDSTAAPDSTGAPDPEAVRAELGAPGRPLILAAGRLAPQKGFGSLIEAARGWQDLSPVPLLAIAGSGPLQGELAAAAAVLGPSVVLLGQRADIPSLLAAADLFVLPSRWEGQPLILQEALRAGRPIVATRAGGTPDLTGEDGALLVPPDDPAALAGALNALVGDPGRAEAMGAAGRKRAAAEFGWDAIAAQTVGLYAELTR